ncbi:MAG: hypothetical protein C0175_02915 [Caldisericum exile]|uniref:Polymerase beta nucleotidyltransferase domain-containing protein n=1 Tax=Caldisericum exile TaxID=693075 RepID=A0A2J6X768_9BACT|nr:MAG: hypothetical protein C0175_02915 [Caldisericum exile]
MQVCDTGYEKEAFGHTQLKGFNGGRKVNIENKVKNIIENTVIQYRFSLDSIFLFGSRARGDFKEESDFDILVILKDELPMKERRNLAAEISKTLHNELKFTPFDVIVKSRKEFDEEKDVANTISNEVFLEGIKL